MKKLLKGSELVLGVVHQEGTGHWLRPVEKKERRELPIADLGEAQPGDLVLAEKTGRPPRLAARVDTILGDPFAPRSFSLIAIHKHGIPHEFPEEVTGEAERVAKFPILPGTGRGTAARSAVVEGGSGQVGSPLHASPAASGPPPRPGEDLREDLTHIPIVAIDPADARDHDDAVWAAADDDPAMRAAGRRSSRSPTSASTSAPARRSTRRRASAATASISPTGWCRCCRRRCRPRSAR